VAAVVVRLVQRVAERVELAEGLAVVGHERQLALVTSLPPSPVSSIHLAWLAS
jgi:hypothetical protein